MGVSMYDLFTTRSLCRNDKNMVVTAKAYHAAVKVLMHACAHVM